MGMVTLKEDKSSSRRGLLNSVGWPDRIIHHQGVAGVPLLLEPEMLLICWPVTKIELPPRVHQRTMVLLLQSLPGLLETLALVQHQRMDTNELMMIRRFLLFDYIHKHTRLEPMNCFNVFQDNFWCFILALFHHNLFFVNHFYMSYNFKDSGRREHDLHVKC